MSKVRIVAPKGDTGNLLVWVNGVDVSRMATVISVEPEIVMSFLPDRVIIDDLTLESIRNGPPEVVVPEPVAPVPQDVPDPVVIVEPVVAPEEPTPDGAETVGSAPANEPVAPDNSGGFDF